jgi:hypothetical protein
MIAFFYFSIVVVCSFYAAFFSVTTGFVFTYLALQLHPLLEHDVNTNPVITTAITFFNDILLCVCRL